MYKWHGYALKLDNPSLSLGQIELASINRENDGWHVYIYEDFESTKLYDLGTFNLKKEAKEAAEDEVMKVLVKELGRILSTKFVVVLLCIRKD